MDLPPKPWPTEQIERPEPLVARVLADNPGHFTYTGTQTYLVGDARGLAVIDPGPADDAHLAALIAAIGDAPVVAILCTHTHRDHSPAAAPLARMTGAPIVGCAPLTLADDGPRSDAAFDPDYAPDRVLTDGEQVAGPGWTLTAVSTPGHTSNHLCFALEETGAQGTALFSGDHVMGWSTSVIAPPDGNMGQYLASLEKLRRRDERIFYPTHGSPITDPKDWLSQLIAHRRLRERQIVEAMRGGDGDIAGLVDRLYPDIAPTLRGAASQQVRAHLDHLIEQGAVTRDGDSYILK